MKWSKISILLFAFFICGLTYAKANQSSLLTEQQVHKLAAAAWKEQPESIDVTFYREWTRLPKPIEQIRREVEEDFERDIAALGENPHPILLERTKKSIERNIQRRIKSYQFPRLINNRIRISGHNQRVDQVIAEPGEELDPNMPFDGTYVNVGDRRSDDFFSFDYHHKIKSATIKDKSGFVRRYPARFAYMPSGISWLLKAGLGVNQGTERNPDFVPDPNKMQEFRRTGILADRFLLTIAPDPNAPDTRDRIELRDPNYLPAPVVMICDREDYSRVYHAEFRIPGMNHVMYLIKCSNFDSQGFPRNVTEIQYDIGGNFREKSVYRIEKVELNPSIPDEVFKFNPPEDYEVDDRRPPEKRPKNVNYLTTEDVREALRQVDKAFRERDLITLKEFLKHKFWRVRSTALGLITGVAEGEELKKIVESVRKDKNNEVREKAERILKGLQK